MNAMTIYSTPPLSLENIRTYPLARRKSKVIVGDFARVPKCGALA